MKSRIISSAISSLFILYSWGIIAIGRWSYIISPSPSPDEVQAGANALRILNYGISWNALDGTTVGPLNSLILAWPYLLGFDVTLSTIRITSLVLLCITVLFTYSTIRTISNRFYAIILSLPLTTFYALDPNPDLQHYNSESLSLTLICITIYVCVRIFYNNANVFKNLSKLKYSIYVGIIGILLGTVPFCKIQALPIVLVIVIFTLFFIFSYSKGIKRNLSLSVFIAVGLIPTTLLLLPLAFNGEFHHFWNSYIIWPTLYILPTLSVPQLYRLIGYSPLIIQTMFLSFCLLIIALIFRPWQSSNKTISVWPFFFVSVLCAAYFSIIRPGHLFVHYLMFLPPFLLILLGYLLQIAEPLGNTKYLYQFLILILTVFLLNPGEKTYLLHLKSPYKFTWYSPQIFRYLSANTNDKLLIWGWMPQWYVSSGLTPATRESHTNNQLVNSKLQNYFRQRLMSDLVESKPAYIIDAVAGQSFVFDSPITWGINSFDELAKFVKANYVLIHGIKTNSECARTYIRKDRYASLSKQLVTFTDISASSSLSDTYSPQSIDDYSITEDTCIDYWLTSRKQMGNLNIKFSKPEKVSKILILNAQDTTAVNSATPKIRLELSNDSKIVEIINQDINFYPYWTEITLTKPIIANSLRLIMQYRDGGINEVKVFRTEN